MGELSEEQTALRIEARPPEVIYRITSPHLKSYMSHLVFVKHTLPPVNSLLLLRANLCLSLCHIASRSIPVATDVLNCGAWVH
jgi:hypothetical protein